MKCPIHNEPVRVEYWKNATKGEPWITGFCLKCLKHYPRCLANFYMESCELVLGHEGAHVTERGREWTGIF